MMPNGLSGNPSASPAIRPTRASGGRDWSAAGDRGEGPPFGRRGDPGGGDPRVGVTVKLDRGLVAQARFVAATRKISLAEYLTEALRGIVRRDFDRAAKGDGGGV